MKYFILFASLVISALAASLEKDQGADIAKQTAGTDLPVANKTLSYREKLAETIFKGYNKNLIPDNPDVKLGLTLIHFDANADKQVLESNAWLKLDWTDERLSWKPEEYGGVNLIRYDPDQLWKPDMLPYNSAEWGNMMECYFQTQVLLYSSGRIIWVPPCKLVTKCKLTLLKNPYDEQTCSFKFGSWTYDGITMDVNLDSDKIDTSAFWKDTSKYEIIKTTAEKDTKIYDCCPEPYHSLNYNVTFKRIPGEEFLTRLR